MKSFVDEVAATPGGGAIKACIQCGICTGSCPQASRMEYPPRKVIAMIRAGMRDEVLSSSAMWHCLSCYMCTERCPKGVRPADIAHALESLAVQYGYRPRGVRTPAMYNAFVGSVRSQGRVHEFLMMLQYYMKINPFSSLKALPIALKLFSRKRMPLVPEKVKGKEDLAIITRKFREIRGNNS